MNATNPAAHLGRPAVKFCCIASLAETHLPACLPAGGGLLSARILPLPFCPNLAEDYR